MYVVASDAAAVPVSGLDLDIGITVPGFRQIASISKKLNVPVKLLQIMTMFKTVLSPSKQLLHEALFNAQPIYTTAWLT